MGADTSIAAGAEAAADFAHNNVAMARLTGAQALARARRAEGIDGVFGIVGTHNIGLFDALYEVADAARLIPARHAGSAGFMAVARPGGAFATIPPPWL